MEAPEKCRWYSLPFFEGIIMKKIVPLCILLFSGLSLAKDERADPCLQYSDLAEQIMKSRQSEVPMAKLVSTFNEWDGNSAQKQLVKELIIDAYERPAFRTPENQSHEVVEFQNKVYLACTKSRSGKT